MLLVYRMLKIQKCLAEKAAKVRALWPVGITDASSTVHRCHSQWMLLLKKDINSSKNQQRDARPTMIDSFVLLSDPLDKGLK